MFQFHNYQNNNLPFIHQKENQKQNSNNNINNYPLYKKIHSLNSEFLLKNHHKPIINNREQRTISTTKTNRINTLNSLFNSEDELSKYIIGKELGKGAYAKVILITDKYTKKKYAMKIYEKIKLTDNSKKKSVLREIEIMKKVNHKNIVKLKEIIYTQKEILIIMEYINGISLREYYNKNIKNQFNLTKEKEKILKTFFIQIFSAMGYLHRNHMAHRDIKLENILLDKDNEIKIIDFGFGIYNPENKLQNFFCGTPNYMSPEILNKKYYLSEKSDLWSLGILFYKMCCADFPFKGKDEKELFKVIKKGVFNYPNFIPSDIKNIINHLIVVDPNKRISCDDILKFSWFIFN